MASILLLHIIDRFLHLKVPVSELGHVAVLGGALLSDSAAIFFLIIRYIAVGLLVTGGILMTLP